MGQRPHRQLNTHVLRILGGQDHRLRKPSESIAVPSTRVRCQFAIRAALTLHPKPREYLTDRASSRKRGITPGGNAGTAVDWSPSVKQGGDGAAYLSEGRQMALPCRRLELRRCGSDAERM